MAINPRFVLALIATATPVLSHPLCWVRMLTRASVANNDITCVLCRSEAKRSRGSISVGRSETKRSRRQGSQASVRRSEAKGSRGQASVGRLRVAEAKAAKRQSAEVYMCRFPVTKRGVCVL